MSKGKMPPVPPAGRSTRSRDAAGKDKADLAAQEHRPERRNVAEQGRQGNIRQNTRHQGYQQDR